MKPLETGPSLKKSRSRTGRLTLLAGGAIALFSGISAIRSTLTRTPALEPVPVDSSEVDAALKD